METSHESKEPVVASKPEETTTVPPTVATKKLVISKKMVVIAIVVILVLALAALIYRSRSFFIAATVNGSTISRLTVIKELEKVSGKNVLNAMIERQLIADEALKKNISVSQDEVNTEMAKIEEQIKAQGSTLDQALTAENMTRDDLIQQLTTQKKLEKILADKIAVSDEEAVKYLKDNAVVVPEGQDSEYQTKAKDLLRQQKLSLEAGTLMTSLKAAAKIKYFVTY